MMHLQNCYELLYSARHMSSIDLQPACTQPGALTSSSMSGQAGGVQLLDGLQEAQALCALLTVRADGQRPLQSSQGVWKRACAPGGLCFQVQPVHSWQEPMLAATRASAYLWHMISACTGAGNQCSHHGALTACMTGQASQDL